MRKKLRRAPADSNRDNLYNESIYDDHMAAVKCANNPLEKKDCLTNRVKTFLGNRRVQMTLLAVLLILIAYFFMKRRTQVVNIGGFINPIGVSPVTLPDILRLD